MEVLFISFILTQVKICFKTIYYLFDENLGSQSVQNGKLLYILVAVIQCLDFPETFDMFF
jgi:hypothetical protein